MINFCFLKSWKSTFDKIDFLKFLGFIAYFLFLLHHSYERFLIQVKNVWACYIISLSDCFFSNFISLFLVIFLDSATFLALGGEVYFAEKLLINLNHLHFLLKIIQFFFQIKLNYFFQHLKCGKVSHRFFFDFIPICQLIILIICSRFILCLFNQTDTFFIMWTISFNTLINIFNNYWLLFLIHFFSFKKSGYSN